MNIEKEAASRIEEIINEFLHFGINKNTNDPLYVAQKQLFRATWILGSIESVLYSALRYCPESFIDASVSTLEMTLDNIKDVTKCYKKELDKFDEM